MFSRKAPRMQGQAKAMNAFFSGMVPERRYYDGNGFLHITLRFMRTGLLQYAPTPETFPDGVPPGAVGTDGLVTVLVEPADLAEADSLASLAGLDCLRKHAWASPEGLRDNVGSVAGTPVFDGKFVEGEAVIKDAEIIRRLELPPGDPERLVEVSAGYTHLVAWEPEPYAGKAYAGRQRNIRYNHFTLLPEGEGRCGKPVRVTNSKETEVAEPNGFIKVWSRLFGRPVYAMNEKEAEEIAEADAKAKNAEGSGDGNEDQRREAEHEKAEVIQGEERKALIDEMIAKITALTAERDELVSQLEELKKSLDAGISADKVEAEADQMAAERDDAAQVMNSAGFDRQQAMNAFKEKRLRGTALKVFAMNSIRERKGRPAIPEEQAASAIAVNAMWDVVREAGEAKTVIVGAPLAGTAMNQDEHQSMRDKTLHGLGFRTKK